MDKKLKIAIPVIAGALALSGVGAAFASNADQPPAAERPAVTYDTAGTTDGQDDTTYANHCGYGGMMGDGAGFGVTQQVADLLGTTTAELRAQLEAGRTLAEIAAEQGVSQEVLIDTIIAPYNEHLDIMVKYGYLTEDEAVTLRQQTRERLQIAITSQSGGWNAWHEDMHEAMEEYGHGGMMGGFGGGMMKGWGGSQQAPDTDTNTQRGFGRMMGGFGGGMMR
jgi:hypothetical protein